MSFVIIPKKDPKKLQNLWAPSLTTVHISLVGWDQGAGGSVTAHLWTQEKILRDGWTERVEKSKVLQEVLADLKSKLY